MFEEEGDSGSTPATMFPFLSVLFCTIGALVVIMVIGSMLVTVRGEGFDVRLENVRTQAQKLAELQGYIAAMKTAVSEKRAATETASMLSDEAKNLTSDYEKEDADLAGLVAKGDEDRKFVEKADLALARRKRKVAQETTITEWRASKNAVEEARTEKSELSKQIETATSEIDKLKAKAKQPVAHYRFAKDSDGREPVMIELKADGIVVRSDGAPVKKGVTVTKSEASAKSGFLDELAASLTRPGADRYVVLFVRPDATDLFFAATDRLRKKRAPHTAEPVEDDWRLEFEAGDASPN